MKSKVLVLTFILSLCASLNAEELRDSLNNVEWSVTKDEYKKAILQLAKVRNAIEAEFQKKFISLLPSQVNGYALQESNVPNSPIKPGLGFNNYQRNSPGDTLRVKMMRSYLNSSSGRGISVYIGDSDKTIDCFDPKQNKETVSLSGGNGYLAKDGTLCSSFSQFRVVFKATGDYKPDPPVLKPSAPSSELNPQALMKRDVLAFAQQFPLSQLDMFLQRAR